MIRLRNVSKYLEGESEPLFKGVSFDINQGDYVVITGSPAIARNSLVRILSGICGYNDGSVFIDGVELVEYNQAQLSKLRREKFSCLLLDMELDAHLDVISNVKLPLMFAGRSKQKQEELAMHALSVMGLQRLVHHRIEDLTSWQKNKVLLARAIVSSPRTLVVEEPCRNLDPEKIAEVEGLLAALNAEGITIIISSNQSYYAEKARIVLSVASGEVVETKRVLPLKKEKSAAKAKKSRKKKEDLAEETNLSADDDKIDTSGESAEIFESEKQMTFEIFEEKKEESSKKRTRKKQENKEVGKNED